MNNKQKIQEIDKILENLPYLRFRQILPNKFVLVDIVTCIGHYGEIRDTETTIEMDGYACYGIQEAREFLEKYRQELKENV